MVSETENKHITSNQQTNSFIPWLILIMLVLIVCCCCVVVGLGWFLGDFVIQIMEQILQGYQ